MLSHLVTVALVLAIPSLEANPRFWPWQARSSRPSIVTISIGNRIGNTTGLNDRGTYIRDLAINLSRWNGNLTFAKNGTEIFVTRGNDGITNIRIAFTANSTASSSASPNATQSTRRRKRAVGMPSLPNIPIPTLNSSQAFIDGNFISLPSAISRLASPSNDAGSLLQPWQLLQNFLNRRLPMLALDTAVSFLSQLYSSTGKRMVDTGVNALGETTDYLSGIVNSALDLATEQVSSGIQDVTRWFKTLQQARQTCVGQIPDDAAGQVVTKATDCVRQRWNEVEEIVNQFLDVVNDTEDAYGGWLQALEGCSASSFAGMAGSELDAAQRECYVKTVANSVGKMVDIPMRWASLTLRTNNAVMNFQPQVGLCGAGVGAEVAAVSANIGIRIVLCQVFQ